MVRRTPLMPNSQVKRRLAAEDRRAQILAVAQELFVTQGVEATSIRRIATMAGVTSPVIYHHFEDKEALLLAVCQEFFKGLIAIGDAAPAPDDEREGPFTRLRGIMRAYVMFGLENPDIYKLVFMSHIASLKRDKFPKGHRRRPGAPPPGEDEGFGMRAFAVLEGEIERLMALGRLKGDDPYALAEVVWATGHGMVSLMITHADFEWTPLDKFLDLSVEAMLHGIAR
ncbi:TetR/AcrR family transcriptional regulator [Oleomonas cavernae]|uniref:TetR/AcrR family transcriptional regulator n=1 Tax=Oleomonas cavernae TaxID=2320859 RepID=A0A418WFM0_9PROT|nr:TetR/AcrR family transcriptional regulator [Oleomonas cavernae]RJF88803.1 TetR/AcrR family transcriptional regulator [Oleomonas cavernae]